MPTGISYYKDLVMSEHGDKEISLDGISLRHPEAAVALKVHDYGVEHLNEEELHALYTLIGKLKDVIHP